MERVRLVNEKGELLGKVGTGLFTQRLMQKYPWLPVEEDGRLLDAGIRESFVTRIYALSHWQQMMADGFSIGKLLLGRVCRLKIRFLAKATRMATRLKLWPPCPISRSYFWTRTP